jgi:hypothetical protein
MKHVVNPVKKEYRPDIRVSYQDLIRGHKDRHGITESYGSVLVRMILKNAV